MVKLKEPANPQHRNRHSIHSVQKCVEWSLYGALCMLIVKAGGGGFNPTFLPLLRQPVEVATLTFGSRKCGDLRRRNVAVSWSEMESYNTSPVPGPCRFCSFHYIPSDSTGSRHHFPKNIVLTHLECSNSLRIQLLVVVRCVTCYCESAFDRS